MKRHRSALIKDPWRSLRHFFAVYVGERPRFRRPDRLALEQLEDRTVPSPFVSEVAVINTQAGSSPSKGVNLGGTLIFAADDATTFGSKLWKSDGTAAGTQVVQDRNSGAFGSNFDNFTVVGNSVFFTTNSSGSQALWKTDGTAAGTVSLTGSATQLNNVVDLVAFNGSLFFGGADDTHGRELWKSDGTSPLAERVRGPGLRGLHGPRRRGHPRRRVRRVGPYQDWNVGHQR